MNEFLRATFGRVPELYARTRPGYPDELFDDIVALSGIPARGRVLEIERHHGGRITKQYMTELVMARKPG